MKKLKLFPFFIALFLLEIETFGQNLSLGLKGGGDLTTLYATESKSPIQSSFPLLGYKNLRGFQIGLIGKLQINNVFGFTIEPGFIQKGAQYKNFINTKFRMGYINVPVILFYSPIKNFNIEFGPEAGYRIYNKTNDNPRQFSFNNNFDLCAIIGLSYNINEKFNIGSRYSHGLTKMTDDVTYYDNQNNYLGTQHIYNSNRYFEIFVRYYLFKV